MLLPIDLETSVGRPGDPRIGELLGTEKGPIAVVVGFPSDTGVALNGGRIGASRGPAAIRRALYAMTPGSPDMAAAWRRITDLGDCAVSADLGTDQEGLGKVLGPYLEEDVICIILGGGHETAFGHFLGYAQIGRRIGIVNVDAHPDVRELIGGRGHSGSPFRQALEHVVQPAASYSVFGLAPQSCSNTHLEFLDRFVTSRIWNHEASSDRFDGLLGASAADVMVTIDLDAFDQSVAPGVSAPAAEGLSRDIGYRASYSAGISPVVRSFDVCEMNPEYDVDNRTARFAAMLIWHFVEGLTSRVGISNFLSLRRPAPERLE